MKEDHREYYIQLHEAARHYDTQAWIIPGIFFIAQGAIFLNLNFSYFLCYRNALIFLGNSILCFFLWVQFLKNRRFEIVIQHLIDTKDSFRDSKRVSLYTLLGEESKKKFEDIANKCENEVGWPERDKYAVRLHLSKKISSILFLTAFISFILFFFIASIVYIRFFAIIYTLIPLLYV